MLGRPSEDIFHGLLIDMPAAASALSPAEIVATMHERGVDLRIDWPRRWAARARARGAGLYGEHPDASRTGTIGSTASPAAATGITSAEGPWRRAPAAPLRRSAAGQCGRGFAGDAGATEDRAWQPTCGAVGEGLAARRRELEELTLAPLAARSYPARRAREEADCSLRTPFQRDRDRIVHCKAFRRLKHKTQVFVAPMGTTTARG